VPKCVPPAPIQTKKAIDRRAKIGTKHVRFVSIPSGAKVLAHAKGANNLKQRLLGLTRSSRFCAGSDAPCALCRATRSPATKTFSLQALRRGDRSIHPLVWRTHPQASASFEAAPF